MANHQNTNLNSEVFRLLREKIKAQDQETFLRNIISYIKKTPKELRINFVRFVVQNIDDTKVDMPKLYSIWSDAVAKEKNDRRILGSDY